MHIVTPFDKLIFNVISLDVTLSCDVAFFLTVLSYLWHPTKN